MTESGRWAFLRFDRESRNGYAGFVRLMLAVEDERTRNFYPDIR